jgi:hypothetical protein
MNEGVPEARNSAPTEPYNADTVRQAFANWQTSWNKFLDAAAGTLVEALGQVSPEGRQRLVAERKKARVRVPVSSPVCG